MRILSVLSVCVASVVANAMAITPDDISRALRRDTAVAASVRYAVTMPQMPDDVVYDIEFSQLPVSESDTLAPCRYLIEWSAADCYVKKKCGFSAYYDGHHFRYGGEQRLLEYHMEWDMVPFMSAGVFGRSREGVQRTAQFVDVLPGFIAEAVDALSADNRYELTLHADTVVDGVRRVVLDAVMTVAGDVVRRSEYVFEADSFRPVRVTHENNPGAVSEQTVTVDYDYTSGIGVVEPLNESVLEQRHSEVFAKYRQCNLRIENLRGSPLPGFSLPTTTSERYSRCTGDTFRAPTLVALMESGTASVHAFVKSVREAVDMLPFQVDVVWVFADAAVDDIDDAVGAVREGEHLLMSGRGLVRDYGAVVLPALLFAGADGVVRDVMLGYNKDLSINVIQKMTFINQLK